MARGEIVRSEEDEVFFSHIWCTSVSKFFSDEVDRETPVSHGRTKIFRKEVLWRRDLEWKRGSSTVFVVFRSCDGAGDNNQNDKLACDVDRDNNRNNEQH